MSAEAHPATGFWRRYVFSTDHKTIGMQYLFTGIAMALVGGLLAYGFRMQLAYPGHPVPGFGMLDADRYNTFVTMHGTIMIFWVAMPVVLAAFGNLLIPLMVGADDMAFPALNMMSYWVFFVSTVLLLASFFVPGGAFAGGWTAYPPLSAGGPFGTRGLGGDLWLLAVALEFVAFLMGGINFLVTAFNMRAPGLTWFRLPMVVWMMVIAVLLFMFSVGPLVAGAVMLLLDRTAGTGFYAPTAGGDPLLFQHLFWFFGHPEVYVILLPTVGFVAEIYATFARKPLFGYKLIVYSVWGAGVLSFIVWAHHQFVAGIDPRMASFFSVTTILISVPFTIIVFASIATLWKGSIQFTAAMLFAVGLIAEFLIGGVTGIYLGSSAFDIYAHDTYFVIAHFHYTLIPVVIFGGCAAIYFWYPKFTGRMLDERLGAAHFWLTTLFFNATFLPLFLGGMAGEHRRIYDYSAWASLMTPDLLLYRRIATLSAIGLIVSQFLFLLNLVRSLRHGAVAGPNPWSANSLEWSAPSPPPHGNFAAVPVVYRGPYEYSVEGRSEDFWPQHLPG
ncbi:MAG: cbb3-type cytochrome c oxidase subunit I [Gemmatimonadales bacterium]|jgi:cytochrome c oxidase subunit 1|nr:cbb3-type cytochrome c oxidase subunit I [Gemmatimonadales bacterium]MBP9199306.1 cbb3-type cytochrome c oxidase subunit I [Gemmatimonadales bacterium]